MFNNLIIMGSSKIINLIYKLDLDIFLTAPQQKHVVAFLSAMVLKGYKGKVNDVSELTSPRHRTCIGHF
jgi:hypothetical protein